MAGCAANKAVPDFAEANKNLDEIMSKQVLLTNDAEFSGDRELKGASGFLIELNGTRYAVTARHLLGEEGGVEPSVSPEQLTKGVLRKWEMHPRGENVDAKETVKLDAAGIDYANSKDDIIVLTAVSGGDQLGLLKPSFDDPKEKEYVYLIGCPYANKNCKQSKYDLTFAKTDNKTGMYLFNMFAKVELAGFSGAPIINAKGQVIALLSSTMSDGSGDYVAGTPIKSLQKVKL